MNQFYVLSTSSVAEDRTRVLKHGDTFAVFSRHGDINPGQVHGIYYRETRHLSEWTVLLDGMPPLLLSSSVKDDNSALAVDMTNPDIHSPGQKNGNPTLKRGTLHIERTKFLWMGTQYERMTIHNYSSQPRNASLSIRFDADFVDVFEVRGTTRKHHGQRKPVQVAKDEAILRYHGLDGVNRTTRVRCSPRPHKMSAHEILLQVCLEPHSEKIYELEVSCESDCEGTEEKAYGERHNGDEDYETASTAALDALSQSKKKEPKIHTASGPLNDWLVRSMADVRMMVTETPHGPYPYGGVPWFNTAFGRDGLVTALESLWLFPDISRGVLSFLAATQATTADPENDAEPGKIIHETRQGEMAALKEVPFGCYYGSIDSTPLFLMLAGAYFHRTGDIHFIQQIWPNIRAALRWIDEFGDSDRDGFVEYKRQSKEGLVQQGWKDSNDSVFHSDGSLAEGPIALCEVQAYVYGAKCQAAQMAAAVGDLDLSHELKRQAHTLREQFEQAFWCEEIGTYALALDGKKRPCRVRTSNAGHCLFTGIASAEHAKIVAQTLLGGDFFCGWGIRTVSAREVRYNPMSYHNGSVWPHDNAIIAAGLARYGNKQGAVKILNGLLDASLFLEYNRLPELFCGFSRREGEGPTLYPIACAPQSWAAASPFLMLCACLGADIQGQPPVATFHRAELPESVPRVEINDLSIGGSSTDIALARAGQGLGITVLRKESGVDIVSIK